MQPEQRVSITGRTLVFGLALMLGTWLAPALATFASVTVLALIMAAALVPPIAFVRTRFKLQREAAVTAVFTAMMVGLGIVTFLIVPTVMDQIRSLATNLPHYVGRMQGSLTWLQQGALTLGARFGLTADRLPPLPDIKAIGDAASAHASSWVGSSLGLAGQALSLFGMGLLVLMLAFFVLLEGPALRASLLSLVPPPQRALIDAQIDPITGKLGGYVQGMAIGIAALAVYQVIVLSALGLPLALALGLLSALMAIVPLVGGFIGVIPPALIGLSVSWQAALWALVLGYLGHFIVANFLMPVLFSRSVKLSPLMVTVALLVGGEAMGTFGALVAVPMAAAIQVLVQNLYVALLEQKHAPGERAALTFANAPLPRLQGWSDEAQSAESSVPRSGDGVKIS